VDTPTSPPRIPPPIDDANRAFWTGGASRQLLIQRCEAEGTWVHPPRPSCPDCDGQLSVHQVSGAGTVFTYTVARHQYHPEVPTPVVVAIVELVEQPGLRFTTNIVNCDPAEVAIGMPVHVTFEPAGDHAWAPVFEPA